jgi:hypothetical protein
MPAVAAESNIRVTVYNIPTTRKMSLARAGSDNFRKDDTLYTTVEFRAVEVEQSSEFVAATDAAEWLVNDGSNALGTVWGGALQVTGALTPSGGIVGKTDGAAVAAGMVGEYSTAAFSEVVVSSTATTNVQSRTIAIGTWLIWGIVNTINSAYIDAKGIFAGIGIANNDTYSGYGATSGFADLTKVFTQADNAGQSSFSTQPFVVSLVAPTTYFLNVALHSRTGGSLGVRGSIKAIRIA